LRREIELIRTGKEKRMSKTFLKNLAGEKTENVPFWFMRQAGRYLPEYRELRADKGGFLDMVYDPVAACEVTMQPIRRFGMSAAILFSDILVVPHALGQDLKFVAGEGPKLKPIRNEAELAALDESKFDDVLSPIYGTVSNVRAGLKSEGFDDTALIGFAGSPWTVACYMVEGQGSKEWKEPKIAAYGDPAFFGKLIDILVERTAQYLIAQVDAGAEALQLFDSWSGALDSEQFHKWVIEPTRRIVDLIHVKHPNVPIIGFARMAGNNITHYLEQSGVDALGLDTQIDTAWAARTLQTKLPVQGNLDPFCLFAGGDALNHATYKILDDLGGAPFIFNLGHGINKDTPIAHVEQLVKILKDYKR